MHADQLPAPIFYGGDRFQNLKKSSAGSGSQPGRVPLDRDPQNNHAKSFQAKFDKAGQGIPTASPEQIDLQQDVGQQRDLDQDQVIKDDRVGVELPSRCGDKSNPLGEESYQHQE